MNVSLLLPVASLSVLLLASCIHHPQATTAPALPPRQEMATVAKPAPSPSQASAPVAKPASSPSQAITAIPSAQQEILASLPLGIIGGTEKVFIETIPKAMTAKVDTGADTSSIHAENIKFFERDGKPWVRFQLTHPADQQVHTFERRIKRRPKIKRHGADSIRRPVVEMTIKLGNHRLKCDFTLTDRSRFECPILLGQNLLDGRAAVDVSRNNILSE